MELLKISICIPIYNRAKELKRLLESIKEQDKNIEIVISDNNSTDNILEVIEEYKKIFKNLKYIKNNKNMGFDYNLNNAVNYSTGNYIWLMGSDDIIDKNSLKMLKEEITKDEADIYILNGKIKSNKKLKNRDGLKNIRQNKKYINIQQNLYRYINDIENDISLFFAFISSLVLKRKLYVEVEIPNNIKNSAYDHIFKILKMIYTKKEITLKYLHRTYYIAGDNENEWNVIKGKHFFLDITSMKKILTIVYKDDTSEERKIKYYLGKLFERNGRGIKKIFNIYYAKSNNQVRELEECFKYFEIYNLKFILIKFFLANKFFYKILLKLRNSVKRIF